MPAGAGSKRVKGVSIYRPFVFGSIATPLDPNNRPKNLPAEHTHQWTVFVRGVDGADITYWLKKVQFKLHETYTQPLRNIEAPAPFEVTETGWGEFEVGIRLFFTSESNEKAASVYHQLRLHPYGDDREAAKERGDAVVSQSYEEVVFNEPSEAFYDLLTRGEPPQQIGRGKATAKSTKTKKGSDRTAEIPAQASADNPYSVRTEEKELDRLSEAIKQVGNMVKEEQGRLTLKEEELDSLRKSEGVSIKSK